jgi:DNA-binding transcriptional regulator/RsmH inhibitor MraZ
LGEETPEAAFASFEEWPLVSSTARTLSSRVASTTEKVQGDEYFNVEKILEWRRGKAGLEYLVKWVGYGKKYNSWEPAAHFEQCLETLEQFHQEKGLPPPCM